MIFAGIWVSWRSPAGEVVESCSILTTATNRLLAGLHDRLPVILSPDEYKGWIDWETTNPADLVHLFQAFPADLMEMWPVSMVNKVGNDGPEVVVPVGNTQPLDLGLAPSQLEVGFDEVIIKIVNIERRWRDSN